MTVQLSSSLSHIDKNGAAAGNDNHQASPTRNNNNRSTKPIVKIIVSCFLRNTIINNCNYKKLQRKEYKTWLKLLVLVTTSLVVPVTLYRNYFALIQLDRKSGSITTSTTVIETNPAIVSNQYQSEQQKDAHGDNHEQRNAEAIESNNQWNNDGNITLPSGLLSSSLSLSDVDESNGITKILPIQSPYGLCDDQFVKVSCDITLLIEKDDITNNDIGIPIVSNEKVIMKTLCNDIFMKNASSRFTTDGTPDKTIILPVCIQYYDNSFSIPLLLKSNESLATSYSKPVFDVIQSIESNRRLQALVRDGSGPNTDTKVRVLELKYVDFPFFYRRMNNYDIKSIHWKWEKFRDENYGNMVWRYASTMLLNPLSNHYSLNYGYNEEKLQLPPNNRSFDTYIIATANTLHITKTPELQDFVEYLTQRVQRWNVSTIVVGIGIQFEFDDNEKGNNVNIDMTSWEDTDEQQQDYQSYNLSLYHKFQKEFLQEISYRQATPGIGVRGDLTKSICDSSGISNCVSMGCPSLTMSHNTNLGKTLQTNWDQILTKLQQKESPLRIAVTFPAYGGSNVVYTVVEMICLLLDMYTGNSRNTTITLIQQDKHDATRLEEYMNETWSTNHPQSKLNFNMVPLVEYYNVETWLYDASTKYDLCISSRIHGSMTFISSGIPTVAIPTDFRIMELLDSMKVPYLLPTQLQRIITGWNTKTSEQQRENSNQFVLSIAQQARNRNFTIFELNRRSKIQQWQSILNDNGGIEINPALLKILRTPL